MLDPRLAASVAYHRDHTTFSSQVEQRISGRHGVLESTTKTTARDGYHRSVEINGDATSTSWLDGTHIVIASQTSPFARRDCQTHEAGPLGFLLAIDPCQDVRLTGSERGIDTFDVGQGEARVVIELDAQSHRLVSHTKHERDGQITVRFGSWSTVVRESVEALRPPAEVFERPSLEDHGDGCQPLLSTR